MLLTAKINALQSPRKDNLALRRRWYEEESGGDQFLYGVEASIFSDSDVEADLITFNENIGSNDSLAHFLGATVVPFYHQLLGHKLHQRMSEKVFDATWEYRPETLVVEIQFACSCRL